MALLYLGLAIGFRPMDLKAKWITETMALQWSGNNALKVLLKGE